MKTAFHCIKKDIAIFTGLTLLFSVTLLMVLCSLLRFIDTLNPSVVAVASLILSYAGAYAVLRPKRATFFLGIAVALAIVLVSCLVCSFFYDRSFDGGSYHKEAVFALANGWNPLRESVESWQLEHESFGNYGVLWIDHYAQGAWSVAACLYKLFGCFEAGKGYTLIAMAMAGLIWAWYLRRKRFSNGQCLAITIVLVVNPITVPQFATFYNDALLMMELLTLLAGLFMLADEDADDYRQLGFIITGCAFVMCAETKFTGFAYAGVFSLAFYVLFVIRAIKYKHRFDWRFLGKTSAFFALIIAFSFFVVGYSPYVTNLIDHGNPFYPLFGKGSVDIITNNSPTVFADASNLEKLFLSFFSQSDNILPDSSREPVLKIPLTVSLNEFRSYGAFDLRIGGFGVLYSAILLIQIVVIIVLLPKLWHRSKSDAASILCFLIPALLLMVFLGESWWARYSAYSYFANGIALALIFCERNHVRNPKKRRPLKAVSIGFFLLLVINTSFFLINTGHAFIRSLEIHDQVDQVEQAIADGHRIEIAYTKYPGDVYALETRNIPFEFRGEKDGSFEADGAINCLYYRIID